MLTHGFENTAKCLTNEANSLGFKDFLQKEVISDEVCQNILEQFNGGNWKKFFKVRTGFDKIHKDIFLEFWKIMFLNCRKVQSDE